MFEQTLFLVEDFVNKLFQHIYSFCITRATSAFTIATVRYLLTQVTSIQRYQRFNRFLPEMKKNLTTNLKI